MPSAVRKLVLKSHIRYNRMRYGTGTRYDILTKIVEEIRPRRIMEVGTWNGGRAEAMLEKTLQWNDPRETSYFGFDLFESWDHNTIDKEAGRIPPEQASVMRRLWRFVELGATVELYGGNTNVSLPEAIKDLPKMDLIFIDGGHSYNTVKNDWDHAQMLMKSDTVVVFDDYVNDTAVAKAHIGVNDLIGEIDSTTFRVELLSPVDWFYHPWGLMATRLAKVQLHK